jgi:putative membrane protein
MGSADIVPGVSGGTVALVLGIYDELIHNISQGAHAAEATAHPRCRRWHRHRCSAIEWIWLFSLLGGVFAASLRVVVGDRDAAARTAGPDGGAVPGADPRLDLGGVADARQGSTGCRSPSWSASVGPFFLLLGLRSDTEVSDSALEVVTEPWWVFFLAGAIAICAMILPGISGSFILVMLGMYTEVLGAVNDRDFGVLIAFMLGCVVGLALFSTLLNWLLERYHRWVLAAMIGLMLGSTRVLWPWPNGTNTTTMTLPRDDVAVPVLLIVIGAVVVVAVDLIAVRYVTVEPLHEHEPASKPPAEALASHRHAERTERMSSVAASLSC